MNNSSLKFSEGNFRNVDVIANLLGFVALFLVDKNFDSVSNKQEN